MSMHFLAPEKAAWWIGKYPHLFALQALAPLFNWRKNNSNKEVKQYKLNPIWQDGQEFICPSQTTALFSAHAKLHGKASNDMNPGKKVILELGYASEIERLYISQRWGNNVDTKTSVSIPQIT